MPSYSTTPTSGSATYVVEAQTVRAAISTHQQQSSSIIASPRGDKLPGSWNELQTAMDAYLNGKISGAEYDAVNERCMAFLDAHAKRLTNYEARRQAGQTKPTDFCQEFYGYTDDEAKEFIRHGAKVVDSCIANEARNQSRMTQRSRHGRGH